MKKTRYIKPAITVRQISMPSLLLAASQGVMEGNVIIAPDDQTTIDNVDDFI